MIIFVIAQRNLKSDWALFALSMPKILHPFIAECTGENFFWNVTAAAAKMSTAAMIIISGRDRLLIPMMKQPDVQLSTLCPRLLSQCDHRRRRQSPPGKSRVKTEEIH